MKCLSSDTGDQFVTYLMINFSHYLRDRKRHYPHDTLHSHDLVEQDTVQYIRLGSSHGEREMKDSEEETCIVCPNTKQGPPCFGETWALPEITYGWQGDPEIRIMNEERFLYPCEVVRQRFERDCKGKSRCNFASLSTERKEDLSTT